LLLDFDFFGLTALADAVAAPGKDFAPFVLKKEGTSETSQIS
jgi:hypothetical protein